VQVNRVTHRSTHELIALDHDTQDLINDDLRDVSKLYCRNPCHEITSFKPYVTTPG